MCRLHPGEIIGTAVVWDKVFNLDQSSLRIACVAMKWDVKQAFSLLVPG